MKILITGARGQLGLEVSRQLAEFDMYQVIAADRKMLDIGDLANVESVLSKYMPEVVINCGAYTAVDLAESEIESAYKINSLGAKHLAIVCEEIGAKLVQVSTDYVFDGDNPVPKKEDDITSPQSIYGSSKLDGENNVKQFCSRYFIIRTAWLYGDGNNFVRTMLKLAKGRDHLSVVGDQFGSPTSTKDLAQAIISLINTKYYGTYHGTCEGECSWYDFACEIFRIMDYDIKVNKVTSEEFVRPAKRPTYSVLNNFNLKLYDLNSFRPWQEAIKDYLEQDIVWQKENL